MVWPVHWVAGFRVFDGLIGVFNWFNFSWVLALTQLGLFSVHGSIWSNRQFGPGFENTAFYGILDFTLKFILCYEPDCESLITKRL